MTNLPTVPVHDLKIHPREHELIAATHGRGLWIVEITPLEQLTGTVLAAGAWLFDPKTAYEYGEPTRANFSAGHQWFRAASPAYGAEIAYRLTTGSTDRRAQTKIVITDVRGDTVRTLKGPAGVGLHRVTWGFQGKQPPPAVLSPSQKRDSAIIVARSTFVFDSLAKAGSTAPQLDPIQTALLSGDVQGLAQRFGFGGGGGGGGGAAGGGGGLGAGGGRLAARAGG